MSQPEVYQEIFTYLEQHLRDEAGEPTIRKRGLDRLTLLVAGILKAQHGAPARIAQAGQQLSLRATLAASVERRVRRIENDASLQAETCLQPLVKGLLAGSPIAQLWLLVDATFQEDRVELLSVQAWYRGRSLPLVWATWPANQPLCGPGFWQRVEVLLDQVHRLLPAGVPVIVLADRAFGTPAFTDLVARHGWHWIVRVQGQTVCRDRRGREQAVASLVAARGERRKLLGQVFKKAGWRTASVVAYWGKRYRAALCLATDLAPGWEVIAGYRRRYPIEPSFRDWKSSGWHWEQGQVKDLAHLGRLLLGMALASWLTLLVGALQAALLLAQPPTGRAHTRPWWAKQSLFQLGLQVWASCFAEGLPPWLCSCLPDWEAPNWSTQLQARSLHACLFA